ncbi:MAG TPA: hypothetical protein VFF67_06160 [Thermoplasmata archaeon]|nr:hypothetical protein [Thermoplasmata archaeon]
MAERVGSEHIRREKGYLYYLGKDGFLWRIPTRLNPAGTRARVGSEKILRQDGYMYFIDKAGYISRAKMREEPEVFPSTVCPAGPHELESGEFLELPLSVNPGERIRGRLFEVDGQDFDWYVVNEVNSTLLRDGDEFDFEIGDDHVSASPVDWRVSKKGPWYLVLEIPYRQNPRSVRVELRGEAD